MAKTEINAPLPGSFLTGKSLREQWNRQGGWQVSFDDAFEVTQHLAFITLEDFKVVCEVVTYVRPVDKDANPLGDEYMAVNLDMIDYEEL